MIRNFYLLIFFLVIGICSCEKSKPLSITKVSEYGGAKISDTTLFSVIAKEKGIAFNLSLSGNADSVLSRIINREIDMGIISNNNPLIAGIEEIRTITPLLPRVLMIFTKDQRTENFPDLFKDKIVYYEITGDGDFSFITTFQKHYGLNESQVRIFNGEAPYNEVKAQLDSADIWVSISHYQNYLIDSLYKYGFRLQGKLNQYQGSSLDGFVIKYPQAYPTVIPKYLYDAKPDYPVFTLGVRDILICHKEMSSSVVYDIVDVISEQRTLLTQRNSNYNLLPYLEEEKYRLSFPLHKGTKSYLNREKPTFLERYAEIMALILSIVVLASGYIIEKIQDVRLLYQKQKRLKRWNLNRNEASK